MKDWQKLLVGPEAPLREILKSIERGGAQIVLVAGADHKLMGTLSDGDIRRALIAGANLESRAEEVMHKDPVVGTAQESRTAILAKLRRHGIHQLPIVDDSRRIVGLQTLDELIVLEPRDNLVVVMAGGLGTRLKELTQTTPKPMLKVGDRPLLQILLETFIEQGFTRFCIAVNYKAEVIEQHFGNGERYGADIHYVREQERMGTAGALALMEKRPSQPFFVVNADLLAKVDYLSMLRHHESSGASATMAVREYEFQIPFGVVSESDGAVTLISEKPVHRAKVCAGIYVLSPEALSMLPGATYCDMPNLFNVIVQGGMRACTYELRDYWLDVGRLADFHKANEDFPGIFS